MVVGLIMLAGLVLYLIVSIMLILFGASIVRAGQAGLEGRTVHGLDHVSYPLLGLDPHAGSPSIPLGWVHPQ